MKTHNTANISSAANRNARLTHTVKMALLALTNTGPERTLTGVVVVVVDGSSTGPWTTAGNTALLLLCCIAVCRPFPSHKLLASCTDLPARTQERAPPKHTTTNARANQPLHRAHTQTLSYPSVCPSNFPSCENCPWLFLHSPGFSSAEFTDKSSLRNRVVARTVIGKSLPKLFTTHWGHFLS